MNNDNDRGFLWLAQRRYSVRSYLERPVDRDKISRCLEAARLAPSSCNSQPWTFVVVNDPVRKQELAAAASGGILPINHFSRQAPVLVVVVVEQANASAKIGAVLKGKPFPLMDVAIAAEHFCLQAAEEGLGTCMLGWFDERRVRALLGIPASARPALLLTLGYASGNAVQSRQRKDIGAMSAWNAYPGAEADPNRRKPWCSLAGVFVWRGLTCAFRRFSRFAFGLISHA